MLRTRDFFYILIIAIVGIIFVALSPNTKLEPRGLFLPSATYNLLKPMPQVLPKDVSISTKAPLSEPIGTINIIKHMKAISKQEIQKDQQEIVTIARKLAAKNDANWLQVVRLQPSGSADDPLNGLIVSFKAYRA